MQSLQCFVEDDVRTDEPFIALVRLMQSSVVVRGPHLSILRKIAPGAYVQIHVDALTWAVKKAAALAEDDSSAARDRVATMFKGLACLLAGLSGKEALAMYVPCWTLERPRY